MPAKTDKEPQNTPPTPLKKPEQKVRPSKVARRVTAVPETLNVHLRIHFSLPNPPDKRAFPRKSRWKPEHVVERATIAVLGTGISVVTDDKGDAKLPIKGLKGRQFLSITPNPKQASHGPAGPSHSQHDYKKSKRYHFRPFEVTVVIEGGRFSLTSPPSVIFVPSPGGPPPHAAVSDVTPSDLTIDWKPDWIKVLNTTAAEDPQPPPQVSDCLVLHQTSSPGKIGSVLNAFNNKQEKGKPSAHYIIDVDGHTVKTLHESWKANHVGSSFWQGRLGVNSFSIGIEIVHTDINKQKQPAPRDFTNVQYAALLRLISEIRAAHPLITRQRVVGHSDVEIQGPDGTKVMHCCIGSDRAGDPGDRFDWARLEGAGMARVMRAGPPPPATVYGIGPGQRMHPNQTGRDVAQLQEDLATIGYSINDVDGITVTGIYDVPTQIAVERFRIRYFSGSRLAARPRVRSDRSLDFETAFAIRQVLADNGA
jgi:N-acetyl-anhydromuramyl-L-alanine amidase AmpD